MIFIVSALLLLIILSSMMQTIKSGTTIIQQIKIPPKAKDQDINIKFSITDHDLVPNEALFGKCQGETSSDEWESALIKEDPSKVSDIFIGNCNHVFIVKGPESARIISAFKNSSFQPIHTTGSLFFIPQIVDNDGNLWFFDLGGQSFSLGYLDPLTLKDTRYQILTEEGLDRTSLTNLVFSNGYIFANSYKSTNESNGIYVWF